MGNIVDMGRKMKVQCMLQLMMVFIFDGCSFHYAHGVNKAFRFVESIWLHQKSRQIQFFSEKDLVFIIRAQHE